MSYQKLFKATAILALLVLSVVILVYGKPFLAPLLFGAVLSMLLLPAAKGLQKKGMPKIPAVLAATLLPVLFFGLVVVFVGYQISDIAENANKLEKELGSRYQQLQEYVAEQWGVSTSEQEKLIEKQRSGSGEKIGAAITGILSGAGSFLANFILVLVYVFLFIFFRQRLKNFILQLVPDAKRAESATIISSAQKVVQHYLAGMIFMIVCLWILYAIGFSLVGVRNPIFFAVLCGLLELVPFVGNLTGTALTLLMSVVQGGGIWMAAGIVVVYALVQFIQTYLIEPLVVGAEVNINPMATIIGLVAGEAVWGISGMVLAIPLMGIIKIICDHVEVLHPYGYLLGQDKNEEKGIGKKLKELVGKKSG